VKPTTHIQLVPRSKNEWSYKSTAPIRLHGVVLSYKIHRYNFTFYITLCKHGYETLVSIKIEQYLDQLSEYQLLKMDLVPVSESVTDLYNVFS
jgi:hypothetical protein